MSSDEEVNDSLYHVHYQSWRHPHLAHFLRQIDMVYIRRLESHNRPSLRISSETLSTRPHVEGLPINAYSWSWLQENVAVLVHSTSELYDFRLTSTEVLYSRDSNEGSTKDEKT